MPSLSIHPRFVIGLLLASSLAACLKVDRPSGTQGAGGNGQVTNGGGSTGTAGGAGPGGGTGPVGSGGSIGSAGSGACVGVISAECSGGAGGAMAPSACTDDPNQQHALPYTVGYAISDAAKAQALSVVQSMTLTQKANQLRGARSPSSDYSDIFRTADDTAANVRGFQFADGPRGICLDPYKPAGTQAYATVFPVAALRGASFDVNLEYKIGQAMGDEMIAAGRTMLLAPTVNILRHPAWGRAQETYGEDSFLLGRLGSAVVVGAQEYGPTCVKHYAGNNIEHGRETDVAQMDEQTLQEVYARHFGMIVRDGGVSCVMAAYNLIQVANANPVKCTQSKHLLTDILRGEFGFQGMVLSDWWAMPGGQAVSGQASAYAAEAIKAGMDMELPWNQNFSTLESVTGTGIDQADLTKAVQRVVNEKYRFQVGALNGPIGLKQPTSRLNKQTFSIENSDDHVALAYQSALEGIVLLKNESDTLPIKSTVKKVAVVGMKVGWTLKGLGNATGTVNFAKEPRIGDLGSSRVILDPSKGVGPFDGVKAAAPAGVEVTLDDSGGTTAAAAADFVVVVAGLTPQDEGEDYTIVPDNSDRNLNMGLDGKTGGTAQNNFIKSIAALGKPMVVVLEGGSAIDLAPFSSAVPAIVMAWYPGQSGGQALGELLWGKKNFSGKLPISWPGNISELQAFNSGTTTAMPYYLGYRWYDNKKTQPLYPFGHGLSYTTFEYGNLNVPCSTATAGSVVKVTVDVTNKGTSDGDETALVFVSWPSSKVPTRAAGYKELKGFSRGTIPAGKTFRFEIPIRVSDLSYFDTATNKWLVESGPVQVMVGPDANTLTQMGTFTVN